MEQHEKIKSFEDACKALKRKPTLPDVSGWPRKHRKYAIADFKLIAIVEACNLVKGKKWEPNWHDTNQTKYTPWFEVKASKAKPAGFAFSYSCSDYWYTYTFVGSRLCCRTSDIALYVGKQFQQLCLDRYLMT